MAEKEFKTIDELLSLLEDRGISTDDDTRAILMSESYYAIVNGYKGPFLDRDMMRSSGSDVYRAGTSFGEIYGLFSFDRNLRNLTFFYLIKAEAMLKSATVYAFCKEHPGHEDYLNPQNYVDAGNMLFPKGYRGNRDRRHGDEMKGMLARLNEKASGKRPCKDFVSHYTKKHGYVPLWVLSNDLTFGNMSHFYQLQGRSVQNEACRQVFEVRRHFDGEAARLTPQRLLHDFYVLVEYRNICAHDERLYCARAGRSHDIRFSDMMTCLSDVLPRTDMDAFRCAVEAMAEEHGRMLSSIEPQAIMDEMGLAE